MDRTNRNCNWFSTRPEVYGTYGQSPEIVPDQATALATPEELTCEQSCGLRFQSVRGCFRLCSSGQPMLQTWPNDGSSHKSSMSFAKSFWEETEKQKI